MTKRLLATVSALFVVAAACAPGSDSDDRPEEREAADVRTDPAAMGEVTLTVWDQEVRGGQEKQITELNEAFQDQYPNITIDRVPRSFDDLKNTISLGLSGQDGPDVAQVNNGKQDMGKFVEAGLLHPLDGYAEAYGWTDRFPDSVLRLARYPETGDALGEGELYGLAQTGELVGIYYNRSLLADLDIEPPSTWEEFDAALAAAADAGQLPIQFGNLDKASGNYLFALAMHRFSEPDAEVALATGSRDATWPTDANRAAAEQLVDWAESDYLTDGFAGLSGDDSWARFAEGQGVFHVSGTWLAPDLAAAMGDQVGFLLPPETNGAVNVTGGTGIPFAISAKAENPDAAAAYVDFITSPEAMQVLAKHGNLPVLDADPAGDAPRVQRDIFGAWAEASNSPGLIPYLDYATENAYEVTTGSVERLLAGRLGVDEFLDALQADLDESHGGG